GRCRDPRRGRSEARWPDRGLLDRRPWIRRGRCRRRPSCRRRRRLRTRGGLVMAGPPAVIARARTAVRAALTSRLEALADDTAAGGLAPRLLVGLSGGADSLALLATTCWVGTRMGLETEAVIIDHGLQEGSVQIAERARTQAEQVGGVQVPSTAPGGVENAARAARHEALDRRLEERGGLALLLGHTLDDQAEQVLMGLARGAGPRALAGIPRSRGAILRPFLGTGRDERTALR